MGEGVGFFERAAAAPWDGGSANTAGAGGGGGNIDEVDDAGGSDEGGGDSANVADAGGNALCLSDGALSDPNEVVLLTLAESELDRDSSAAVGLVISSIELSTAMLFAPLASAAARAARAASVEGAETGARV